MPLEDGFGLEVLVGDGPLTEYTHEQRHYVESDLHDPKNSKVKVLQQPSADGQQEQEWPFTPFQIRMSVSSSRSSKARSYDCPFHVKLFVDGFQAQKRTLSFGSSYVSDGFAEIEGDCLTIRSYCFSLPRYAKHKEDKLESERSDKIGSIRAEFYTTTYVPTQEYMYSGPRKGPRKQPSYVQATKSDVLKATGGSYTACTTMVGDVAKNVRLRNQGMRRTPWFKSYRPDRLVKTLEIHYRMGHDLVAMGIKKVEPQEVEMREAKVEAEGSKEESKPEVKEHVVKSADKPMFELEPEDKENQVDLVKSEEEQEALEKKFKHSVLRSLDPNVVSNETTTINMAKFSESFVAASISSPGTSGQCANITCDLTNIDSKAGIKLEQERGIITIDADESYDEDALELMDSYIMVSDDDDLYIVEDLIEPSILEVEDSILASPSITPAKTGGAATSRRSSIGLGHLGVPD